MGGRRPVVVFALMCFVALIGACSTRQDSATTAASSRMDVVTVGSFDFPESRLLAELYSQRLEAAGFPVERAFSLGPREFVAPALVLGLVDLVPDYAGSAAQFYGLGAEAPSPDVAQTHEQLVRALGNRPVSALAAAPAQDANTFVAPRATADEHRLRSLSDVAGVADQLTFGGAAECSTRPLCLVGLQKVYGTTFETVVPLDTGGPVTRQALSNGDIDVGLLFTSDPVIDDEGLVELADDRGLQPAENVTPLVRSDVLARFGPRFADAVDGVSRRLTTEALRGLNGAAGASEADVAA